MIHHGSARIDDTIRAIIYPVRKNFKQIFLVNPCKESCENHFVIVIRSQRTSAEPAIL